jgi:hypothetical protein
MSDFITEFEDAAKKQTDKTTHHGYQRFYPYFLQKFVGKAPKILEIGIQHGGSMILWSNYLKNPVIFGIDINSKPSSFEMKMFQADQSKVEDLDRVMSEIDSKLDIIVDDGSHHPEHQLLTFNHLFKHLNDGGVYIIEDIETNYWKLAELYGYNINYGLGHPDSLITAFKSIADCVNSEFDKGVLADDRKIALSIQKKIEMVTFGHNCVIIVKKDERFKKFYNRPYTYQYFTDEGGSK